jgi:NAD(P)-dependent dehydrogenase (short-subunit alcohol dehydrogenase family)
MSVTGRVAAIAGASQGIGEGVVRAFLDRGSSVVANSRSIARGNPTRPEDEATGEPASVESWPTARRQAWAGYLSRKSRIGAPGPGHEARLHAGKPRMEYRRANRRRPPY